MRTPAAGLAVTERAQSAASDPTASAWVSANAGTGKTHVLKLRVLRLLLAGTAPERLLCLTYTKAAAAEMSQRVFADLARWATISGSELDAQLQRLLGHSASADETNRARQLFARAIETPGGLKFQTIHAFCERLLQRFPLEAGVPPGFSILDDEGADELLREAINSVLERATRNGAPLAQPLRLAATFAAGDRFDDILREALAKRPWVEQFSRLQLVSGDAVDHARRVYRQALQAEGGSLNEIERSLANLLSDAELRRTIDALAQGTTSDQDASSRLAQVLAARSTRARIKGITDLFCTQSGELRASLMTKGLRGSFPDVDALLSRAQHRFSELRDHHRAHTLLEASVSLLQLADAVMQQYAEAKARRAALDFEDLIGKTASLLDGTEAAQWVLYKLDGGVDHILVDEAQDTSPAQWLIIAALAQEFFSGAGARAEARTIFAVGDEKQSIYSFQGAAPEMFAAAGDRFAQRALAADHNWRHVPLTLSFRSTPAVLTAVDQIFADPVRTPGLTAAADPVHHEALRLGQAGLIEIWPTETWQAPAPAEPWSPLAEAPHATPVQRLADRIASTIEQWLRNGEILQSEQRPVRAADIVVLVRNRFPFAVPMVRALKARRIPVAGTDRIKLADQIAVLDLIALGDFIVLPEDDLALATVLKSPVFDLDDDDLISFAPGRKKTLWSALIEAATTSPRLAPAVSRLKRWRELADFTPPYEFFASILDKDGMRARLLSRLGPDAADPLDEFLSLAMAYDRAPPSLQGFLISLKHSSREIKRDLEHGRDEVRVMTVHGAKGLEAPIVFLPDTCAAPSARRRGSLVRIAAASLGESFPEPNVWAVKGTSQHLAVRDARRAEDAADARERNRLLYVALTRARDRLYVAGYEGKKGRGADCWYDLIADSLKPLCQVATADDGGKVLRFVSPQTAPPENPQAGTTRSAAPRPLPAWALAPAPRERTVTIPLAPSRVSPLESDDTGELVERRDGDAASRQSEAPSPLAMSEGYRFLRGMLTHALLEHLPSIEPAARRRTAEQFVAIRGQGLPSRVRSGVVQESLAIVADARFAELFGPKSRAEVPVVAEIPDPSGRRPHLRITGQIDRLVVLDHEVLILDYKTNRPPPREPANVARAYIEQLAAYRLVLRSIFNHLPVLAAILWTDGPRLMPIPPALLDEHQGQLWERGAGRLDAAGMPPYVPADSES